MSAQLDTIMANAVSSYLSGQMTLEKSVDYFQTELEKALKDSPPPKDVKNKHAVTIQAK